MPSRSPGVQTLLSIVVFLKKYCIGDILILNTKCCIGIYLHQKIHCFTEICLTRCLVFLFTKSGNAISHEYA